MSLTSANHRLTMTCEQCLDVMRVIGYLTLNDPEGQVQINCGLFIFRGWDL